MLFSDNLSRNSCMRIPIMPVWTLKVLDHVVFVAPNFVLLRPLRQDERGQDSLLWQKLPKGFIGLIDYIFTEKGAH